MITEIRVKNRRRLRDEQSLMLFHTPGPISPTGTPTTVAGIWGTHGTGKSSLVDQIEWLVNGITDGGSSWRGMIPVEANREPGGTQPKTTSCRINTLNPTAEYEYKLSATKERIIEEQLWRRPRTSIEETSEKVVLLLERIEDAVTRHHGTSNIRTTISPEHVRKPVLGSEDAAQYPMVRAIRDEIRGIRIVRPGSNIRDDLELTARTAEAEGPAGSPAGLRRRLVKGLLENLEIELEDLDETPSQTVRPRLAAAGNGARRAAAITGHAAHALTEGHLLVVDPIDIGIHGVSNRALIETFRGQPEESLTRGQLLFTTNSVDLLTDLPANQVWLLDLESPDRSKLESLSSFKNVDPTTVRRAYEVGRFGGVPPCTSVALQEARNEVYQQQRTNT